MSFKKETRRASRVPYDDLKLHEGRAYTGMRVGGSHEWEYDGGRWRETKLGPDQWSFGYATPKRRRHAAPPGSGAPEGTMFHWLLVAHQRVRKVDANTYETFMEGSKWKLGHRRPSWRRWSSEYPGRPSARDRMIEILEDTLARLKAEARADRLEARLDPAVYGDANRRLEEWDPTPAELWADATE